MLIQCLSKLNSPRSAMAKLGITSDSFKLQNEINRQAGFDGALKKANSFLFNIELCDSICGMTRNLEVIKVAVTLMTEKALTWWRSVS